MRHEKTIGKPCAGNPHARFERGDQEPGLARAPRLIPTNATPISAELRGKTMLVTGASAGIGKDVARGLAALGAQVILCSPGRSPAGSLGSGVPRTQSTPAASTRSCSPRPAASPAWRPRPTPGSSQDTRGKRRQRALARCRSRGRKVRCRLRRGSQGDALPVRGKVKRCSGACASRCAACDKVVTRVAPHL